MDLYFKFLDANQQPVNFRRIFNFCLFFIFASGILSNHLSAKDPTNEKATLNLNVKNIRHEGGILFVAVFDDKESFLKDQYVEERIEVSSLEDLNVELKLPFGKYAVSVFHDVNRNEKLNTNMFGIPKEPYGFSNNPNTKFGPPDFDKSTFEFKSDGYKVEIVLK